MYSLQLILGRPVVKTDVVYETQALESATGTVYTATVTFPDYDPAASHRGQPAPSLKQARARAPLAAAWPTPVRRPAAAKPLNVAAAVAATRQRRKPAAARLHGTPAAPAALPATSPRHSARRQLPGGRHAADQCVRMCECMSV